MDNDNVMGVIVLFGIIFAVIISYFGYQFIVVNPRNKLEVETKIAQDKLDSEARLAE